MLRKIFMISAALSLTSILAAQPILITDTGHDRVAVFDDDQNLIWSQRTAHSYSAEMVQNNNILISYRNGVKEVTLDGKTVFDYKLPGECFKAIRLDDGTTLAGVCSKKQSALLQLDAEGKLIKTITLAGKKKGHIDFRHFEMTDKGTILVGHLGEKLVREYDMDGKVLREQKLPGLCYKGIELKNGNILAAHEHGVQEFDKSGKLVWELKDTDVPEMGLKFTTDILENENGNITITNWLGHKQHGKGKPFFTVNKDKEVVWSFNDAQIVREAASIRFITNEQLELFKAAPKQKEEPKKKGKKKRKKNKKTTSYNNPFSFEFEIVVGEKAPKKKGKKGKKGKKSKKAKAPAATAAPAVNLPALKNAIDYLSRRYPEYKAKGFDKKFDAFNATPEKLKTDKALMDKLTKFQKEALTANPLVSKDPILFVVRKQYKVDHHNTATLFMTNEINTKKYDPPGLIKTIHLGKGGEVKTLVNGGATALARDPEIHFNGKKIIFSMRKDVKDNYHIYEINADGSGLKQLTNAKQVADIDPLYLPDDSIVFTSTREPKYCMCNRHIMGNLFKMEADGANIHQIGKSTLFEGHSSLMPDGRIMYDRWEYVDRNFGDAQGLWTVNPDGTTHAVYWGNNTPSPGGVIDGRVIPGTTDTICIFGSCHDRPWGTLAIIDRTKGVDGREPVVRTWPANAIEQVGKGNWDSFRGFKPKYEDPFPLDKNFFLVSRSTGKGEQMGIYLVDTFGNETLLHTEGPGCYDPMPLRAWRRPAVLPVKRDFTSKNGRYYVQDVYIGTHMEGVERGSVKYLRVIEAPEKRSWSNEKWLGQGTIAPGMNWHDFSNKRILGTVPVEADGSAYFEVPADTFVFFQLLDKDGKMVQSMRSGSQVQPGETYGCIGCHEDRVKEVPKMKKLPMALKREPSKLNGWYGKPRLFNYLAEVQPIFDKNCVKCHDFGKNGGKHLLLAPDKTNGFNTSYNELWRKKYISCVGGGPAAIQPALSWGARKSRIIKVLERGHHEVKLTKEEMDRLITWIDINGPYYPTYDTAYRLNLSGRSPLSKTDLKTLSKLTKVNMVNTNNHIRNPGPMCSFDRPELSLCLKKLKKGSKEYNQALAIIQKGKDNLAKTPRADMPGFVPGEDGQSRQKFYKYREQVESKVRKAIASGEKVYDSE